MLKCVCFSFLRVNWNNNVYVHHHEIYHNMYQHQLLCFNQVVTTVKPATSSQTTTQSTTRARTRTTPQTTIQTTTIGVKTTTAVITATSLHPYTLQPISVAMVSTTTNTATHSKIN